MTYLWSFRESKMESINQELCCCFVFFFFSVVLNFYRTHYWLLQSLMELIVRNHLSLLQNHVESITQ